MIYEINTESTSVNTANSMGLALAPYSAKIVLVQCSVQQRYSYTARISLHIGKKCLTLNASYLQDQNSANVGK
jgi:hypothetical protein